MTNLLGRIFRTIYGILQSEVLNLFDRTSLKVYWWNGLPNFGDALNSEFIHMLSGKKVSWINPSYYKHKNYIVIGSILTTVNKSSIVWGAGFLYEDSECQEKPFKVCAVRGPLSRAKLIESGIECPEVYGDPALLLPLIYDPKVEKRYKLGIVAHYIDTDNIWLKNINDPDVLLLDIQSSNPFDFIEQVYSCEKIVSSSLHGLIVADAYGIPSLWVEFSDKVKGKGFKFMDYFLSVGRSDTDSFIMKEETTVDDLLDSFISYEIDINLEKLLNACPFELKFLSNTLEKPR